MLEILWIILFIIASVFTVIFLLKIIDSFRFQNEHKLQKKIYEHFKNKCFNAEKTHFDLSHKEKIFLKDLENYLKCTNISISNKIYLRDIFCIYIEKNKSQRLKELVFYTQKNYYCVNDVYLLYDFIQKKFTYYLNKNDSVSSEELNINLLGSTNFEEDEVIDKLLEMSSYEFVKKFSILV